MQLRVWMMATVLVAVGTPAGVQGQSPSMKTVMHEKVENAERLLKPIVTGDFLQIERYSDRLARISFTEISSWQVRPESGYSDRATAFLNAVQRLRKAATMQSRDEATAAYAALVTSCSQCHGYLHRVNPISFRGVRP